MNVARKREADTLFLEVRASNKVAIGFMNRLDSTNSVVDKVTIRINRGGRMRSCLLILFDHKK